MVSASFSELRYEPEIDNHQNPLKGLETQMAALPARRILSSLGIPLSSFLMIAAPARPYPVSEYFSDEFSGEDQEYSSPFDLSDPTTTGGHAPFFPSPLPTVTLPSHLHHHHHHHRFTIVIRHLHHHHHDTTIIIITDTADPPPRSALSLLFTPPRVRFVVYIAQKVQNNSQKWGVCFVVDTSTKKSAGGFVTPKKVLAFWFIKPNRAGVWLWVIHSTEGLRWDGSQPPPSRVAWVESSKRSKGSLVRGGSEQPGMLLLMCFIVRGLGCAAKRGLYVGSALE
ncbi:hypothetical protein Tco_0294570 [Tanacetum coccineum]